MATVRIALECLLHLQRQAVKAAPHVGMATRQPHPRARRDRYHRRRLPFASACISADTVAAATPRGTRPHPPPETSISMTPAGAGAGSVEGKGEATTGSGSPATAENADGIAGAAG